jgi:enterobactin synthetase component D / holo-[acyl-carrier protein] synthase
VAGPGAELAGLFTCPVAFEAAIGDWPAQDLLGQETDAVRRAGPVRRREFIAGRTLARRALAALGAPAAPVPRGADRAPIWPDGYLGSIAHCETACCAVAARSRDARSLGVDLEPDRPLSEALIPLIVSAEELARFERLGARSAAEWTALAFCAKEAFYKSWFVLNRRHLDFRDVDVDLVPDGPGAGRFTADVPGEDAALLAKAAYEGRWRLESGLIWTGVTALGRETAGPAHRREA